MLTSRTLDTVKIWGVVCGFATGAFLAAFYLTHIFLTIL